MASRDVILNIIADIGKYQSELAKVPGVTDKQAAKAAQRFAFQFAKAEADAAKAAARASSKATRRASDTAKKGIRDIEATAERSSRAVGNLASNTARQIPDVISQLQAGADPFTVLTQQGLQVVQQVDTGIIPALTRALPVMGAVGAAAAVAGAAYLYFADQLEEAEAAMEASAETAGRAQRALSGLSGVTEDLTEKTLLLTGQTTKAALETEAQQAQVAEQSRRAIRFLETEIGKREERIQTLREDTRVTTESVQEINRLTAANQASERQIDAIEKKQRLLIETADLLAFGTEALADAKERDTEATKRQEERTKALADLQGILADIHMRNASAEEQIALRRDEQIRKIEELERVSGDHALAEEARHAVEMEAIRQELALFDEQKRKREEEAEAERERREETLRAVEKERQKRIEAAEQAAEAQRRASEQAAMSILGSASSIGNSLSTIAFMSAEAQAQAGKKGAEAAFETAKRLSIAAIGVDYISGAFKALANSGGRPLVAAANIAALTLQKGIAIAQVGSMKPAFDIGGVIRGGVSARTPDQVDISALPGEAVLNRRAVRNAGGERAVRNQNQGGMMRPEVLVMPAYKHFDRFMADEIPRGGRLTRALRKAQSRPTGHRGY